ncbi:MAG: polysaccharide biosynthesis/export family protein [Hyphomicrobiales bacterium]|nr:polysaccharide biosynthesis/export family protein [Hyphomicrobiales bacterium]
MRFITLFIASAVAALSGACSFTPSSGPTSDEIALQGGASEGDYLVVDLDHQTVAALTGFNPLGLGERFPRKEAKSPETRIGLGDVLSITIWEAGEGGLFSVDGRRHADFPSVPVDHSGRISIPYAGLIDVKDKTPLQVQQAIIKGLADRAIQPQVVVSIAKNVSNTAVVSGDVSTPGRYPLSVAGERLLDVVAAAGGAKHPARETYITFIRGSSRGVQLLETVVENSEENIFVTGGDRIYLSHEPKKFTVFGAVPKPGVYAFDSPRVNLLEAIAAAGGPLDNRADATGLFLFRYEPRDVVQNIRPDYNNPKFSNVVPVVYRVSLRDPNSYFLARGFLLKDKDVLYTANAKAVELSKVLRMIALGSSTVSAVTGRGGVLIGE